MRLIDVTWPAIIAHRGGRDTAPGNTAEALHQCRTAGVAIVEIDVWATADGAVALMHDASLTRTTDLDGQVAEATVPQLLRGRVDSGGGGWPTVGIPLLGEVFAEFGDSFVWLVEFKDADAIPATLDLIAEHGLGESVALQAFPSQVDMSAALNSGLPFRHHHRALT